MRKTIAIIFAVLFVFAVTSISFAAEKAKVNTVTGEVKAVDTAASTVTVAKKVKGKEVETVVTVDDKTKIMMGKENKTLADVMAGDKVTVKYTEVEGKNVAKSIAIKAAETAPAEKKAKPTKKK